MNNKKLFSLGLLLSTIASLVLVYFSSNSVVAEDESLNVDKIFYDLKLVSPTDAVINLKTELALTPEDRARGLMFRKSMAENESMLFIFPTVQHYKFWMKNTYIPLDMIFAKNGEVVGVVENTVPHSLEPRGVASTSNMVLEVNAGFVEKHGIESGWRIVTVIQGAKVE